MASNYTNIKNVLFDKLDKLEGLTGSDFRVLLCVIRNTTCYHTDAWSMSLNYLVSGTNLSKRQIQRSLSKLSKLNLIEIIPAHGTTNQIIKFRGDKFGLQSGQSWSDRVDKTGKKCANSVHQETKVEIKVKESKEKEKASPSFFPCETELMKAMPENERQKYIELLPEHLRTKNPDDYSESEWDIYDEWRTSNGLI